MKILSFFLYFFLFFNNSKLINIIGKYTYFENAIEKDLQSAFNAEEVKRFLKKGWEI